MKKFLLFIFILLFSTNSFAETIVFDRCWDVEEDKSFNDMIKDTFKNRTYEVNLDQGTVSSIVVYHDEHVEKSNDLGVPLSKTMIFSYRIKAITKKYISTHPIKLPDEWSITGASTYRSLVINVNGEVEVLMTGEINNLLKHKCDKISGTKSDTGSSGAKGFLKKLLGNN